MKYTLSVYEDLAARYNKNEIDRDWVERMLASNFVYAFEKWFWFLTFYRTWENWESIGLEWEKMAQDLRESRQARSLRAMRKRRRQRKQGIYDVITRDSSQKFRIICLPPDPKNAREDEWSGAALLSAKLAEDETHLLKLPDADEAEDPAISPWRAIIIPRSIDREATDIGKDRELTVNLNSYLRSRKGAKWIADVLTEVAQSGE